MILILIKTLLLLVQSEVLVSLLFKFKEIT